MAWSDDKLGLSKSHHVSRALVLVAGLGQILTCMLWRSLVGSIGYSYLIYLQSKTPRWPSPYTE